MITKLPPSPVSVPLLLLAPRCDRMCGGGHDAEVMSSGLLSQHAAQLCQLLTGLADGLARRRHHLDLTLQHLAGETVFEKRLCGPVEFLRHRRANIAGSQVDDEILLLYADLVIVGHG
jgi:hypothetical protein